jgi:hypothetical protein
VLARFQFRSGVAAVAVALAMCVVAASPAAAADTTPTTGCPTPQLLAGVSATGATVATPGAKTRTFGASQATAFMQTWLAYSVFESPPQNYPPAALPVTQLNVAVLENNQPSTLVIFYASDGTHVWVGAPAPNPGPPPKDRKWILAPKPKETMSAFAGTMAPICVDPATSASTAPTSPTTLGLAVKPTSGSSSGNGTLWILIIVGVLVIAAGAVATTRVRGRRRAA